MPITLYTDIQTNGTATSFNPTGNVYIFFDGTDMKIQSTFNSDQPFTVKSIKNDTNYVVSISGPKALVSFFGSVDNTGLNDNDVSVVGVTQIQKRRGRGKNKHKKITNDYFITMIVFIVLFSFMFIGSLILYFTGMMKFHSFGHGAPY